MDLLAPSDPLALYTRLEDLLRNPAAPPLCGGYRPCGKLPHQPRACKVAGEIDFRCACRVTVEGRGVRIPSSWPGSVVKSARCAVRHYCGNTVIGENAKVANARADGG